MSTDSALGADPPDRPAPGSARTDESVHVLDVGGDLVPGGRVRTGRLYRAAAFPGGRPLVERSIVRVVDLRTEAEKSGRPDIRPTIEMIDRPMVPVVDPAGARAAADGIEAAELDSIVTLGPRAVELALALKTDRLAAAYRRLLEEQRRTIAAVVSDVAATGRRACLVWCVQGRDRTGVVVAVIQGLVGVGRDAILAGYTRPNHAIAIPDTIDPALAPAYAELAGVPGGAMCRVLDDRRWSDPGRLASSLGVDDQLVDELRTGLVVAAP